MKLLRHADTTLCSPLLPWMSQIKSRRTDMQEKWKDQLELIDDSRNWSPRKEEHELMASQGDKKRKLLQEPFEQVECREVETRSGNLAWISPLRRRVLGSPCVQISNAGFD